MWVPSDIDQDITVLTLENIKYLKDKGIREGDHLEYKGKYSKSLEETICAFLNTNGGWIILGVKEDDEKITTITGFFKKKDFIENFRKSFTKFDPRMNWGIESHLNEIPLDNNRIVCIIRIPKSKNSIKLNGLYYIRVGSETIKLTKDSEILELKKRKREVDALGREIVRYRKIPKKDYISFIGREKAYKKVIKALKGHHYIISIDGIGGVGKSTLALEIAHNMFEERLFDSVLWFSAKKERFIFSQIISREPEFNNLDNLLEHIAYELQIKNFDKFSKENKINIILKMLKENSFLLILDNLETIDLTESFIEFLARIEGKSKVLITSRKRLGEIERIYKLNPFTIENTIDFINDEIEARSFIIPEPSEDLYKIIHDSIGGIPLAIKLVIGWVVDGDPITQLKEKIKFSGKEIMDFCFKETYEKKLSKEAKYLLCSFAVFPDGIIDEEIEACVDLSEKQLEFAINDLIKYSLISRESKPDDEAGNFDYYKILPLTRLFAYQNLEDFKNLERKVLKKYYNFIEEKKQYLTDLKILEPEIKLAGFSEKQKIAYLKALKATETFEKGEYTTSEKLFKEACKIANDIPEVYYLWGKIEIYMGHLRKTDEIFEKVTSLDPENPTYWLTWANFHKQNRNYSKAKDILNESLSKVPKNKLNVLKRELGIVLSYSEEFNLSI